MAKSASIMTDVLRQVVGLALMRPPDGTAHPFARVGHFPAEEAMPPPWCIEAPLKAADMPARAGDGNAAGDSCA